MIRNVIVAARTGCSLSSFFSVSLLSSSSVSGCLFLWVLRSFFAIKDMMFYEYKNVGGHSMYTVLNLSSGLLRGLFYKSCCARRYMVAVTVARVSDVPEGTGMVVEVNGRMIALFNSKGEFFAMDNVCPHKGGSLGDG